MEELNRKVKEWIVKEGIPLEYFTANSFIKNGFYPFQGHYIPIDEVPREIDVLAKTDLKINDNIIRISHIVECKWTKDKPWVVFTAPNNTYNPSALIAQSIGNKVGQSLLWLLAGCEDLKSLQIFSDKTPSGFSGRQFHEKSNDQFYTAIQSIVSKTAISARETHNRKNPFEFIHILFPLIVIDGNLFSTEYNKNDDNIDLKEVNNIRVNWKGNANWPYNTRVDIVTKNSLDDFLATRKKEIEIIFTHLIKYLHRLSTFYHKGDIMFLEIERASRGIIGYPEFIAKKLDDIKKNNFI